MTKVVVLKDYQHPTRPPTPGHHDGDIIPIVWYQDSREALLYCKICDEAWLDIVALSMPVSRLECECCGNTTCVTDQIPLHIK